jgi:hypothetical protein
VKKAVQPRTTTKTNYKGGTFKMPSTTTTSIAAPDNPVKPGSTLKPFESVLTAPEPVALGDSVEVAVRATTVDIHPDLPAIPVWGYGIHGAVT